MTKLAAILLASGSAGVLAGCNAAGNTPLVFVQAHTLGVSANATTTTPEITLGYRDLDAAVVPVQSNNGQPLNSTASAGFSDALSVLGQFNASAATGIGIGTNLGTMFATGTAAKVLADGYKARLKSANAQ
ncbi:MAG TPA: hypothetical protein VMI72_17465 [Roseiarcus sp.]|nr:hypothetical protein [Roseiarcus sp.]